MKIEASISLRRRDVEVKVHGERECLNLGLERVCISEGMFAASTASDFQLIAS